jgi:uncharacterized protein (DUF1015 family)
MNSLAHRIEPLPALSYDTRRAGPPRNVIAPPYDLIGPELQDELYSRGPYNIVRLELNREADPYQAAARTLDEWLRDGVLAQSAPAIYLYTQRFQAGGRTLARNALLVRIRLEEFSEGRILPHERTFPKAKEDRLRLLMATRLNVSPIFGLYPSGHDELEGLIAGALTDAAAISIDDDSGVDHQLRALDSPAAIALAQKSLADARVLIADGHHRYETALEYRRRMRAAENDPPAPRPYDYVMMALVAFNDPGLVILPTHRLVRHLSPEQLAKFKSLNARHFSIEEFDAAGAMRAKLAALPPGCFGAIVRGVHPRIMRINDYSAMQSALPGAPKEVRELDVSILHALVFDRILGIDADQVRKGGNIEYTIDAAAAERAVESGAADAVFLLNPSTVEELEAVSKTGATMPEKSTYFYPKLVTGLLMNPVW